MTQTDRPGEAEALAIVRSPKFNTNPAQRIVDEQLVRTIYPIIAAAVRGQAAADECLHASATGDEGPASDLPGGIVVRWRCDACGAVFHSDDALAQLRQRLAGERRKVAEEIEGSVRVNAELNYDGTEDPEMAAFAQGIAHAARLAREGVAATDAGSAT